METHETIVIGGGVSGLACCRRLHEAGMEFLLITKELGGRMHACKCACINYGAAYMTEGYSNLLRYAGKTERMKMKDYYFYDGENLSNVFTWKNIRHIPKMVKFLFILLRFRRHWLCYRRKSAHTSIRECFEEDPLLMAYWDMSASAFIRRHRFEELDELYGNPITAATAFVESDKVNTVYYLGMFFPVVLRCWVIHFRDTVARLTEGFEDRITIGSVTEVTKESDGTFRVRSTAGMFSAKYIVFAAPQRGLEGVYDLPKPHRQQPVYVFHILGIRKDIYQNKKGICFRPGHHDIHMLWKQRSGADIVYTQNPKPDFRQYYEQFRVIERVHWDPGMVIPRGKFIEQQLEKNVYLASDYNISSLEDSFLTGTYAANQIINSV